MHQLPHARFANVFGPAEAPACVTHEITAAPTDDRPLPIGTIAPNTHALIVDPGTVEPTTRGEIGELLISAASITRGYWARDDLNQATRATIDGRTYFRTGDLVRRRSDDLLDFIGRGDRMIKSRGYRIELDEVEAALASHDRVIEAATYPLEADETTLVGASLITASPEPAPDELRSHVGAQLPDYAYPAEIRVVDQFPRTTSDKIDRHRLAADHDAER